MILSDTIKFKYKTEQEDNGGFTHMKKFAVWLAVVVILAMMLLIMWATM